MTIRNKSLVVTLALAGGFAGSIGACASTAPEQLVEARNAYSVSKGGLAAKLTPTELYDAKNALDRADKEFADSGDTLECRDYAYIAYRKFELADAKARIEVDRQKIAEAVKMGVVGQELDKTAAQLAAEKQARATAEASLAGAMKDLAAVAAVKEDDRGMVITLSGSVLFVSNKYALLNTAMTKLDQVAEALKAQGADKRMVVEGHTDSRGSDKINQPLSLNRATAVRDYLVSRGVASEKISAAGMGSSKPVADNLTAENRANNRRVEIIISPTALSAR